MFSASCPSCGAPVTFAHPAAVSAVCGSCRSTVVRTDRDLAVIGTIAPLGPEISVLRCGARGVVDDRGFTIGGALRKARERVRWTEWWLVFEDGKTGWLSEGNGAWWIFAEPPKRLNFGDVDEALQAGVGFSIEGEAWRAIEVAEATLIAAEGSLPSEVVGNKELRYADLRGPDGAVGTLDLEERPPRFWRGVATDLASLQMHGTRPVAGWSDPVAVEFEGPTLSAARTLRCPNCGAPITLLTPGGVASTGCTHCGSVLDVEAEGDLARAKVVQRAEEELGSSVIPLGRRGVLEGVESQVVGSIVRYVTVDGDDYAWEELLLWNPWHGYRWLVRGVEGHWNLMRSCPPPVTLSGAGRVPRSLFVDGLTYRRFSHGHPKVRRVLGEFWWEIRVGDRVSGIDWVEPPHMISVEVTHDEEAWSCGHWVDHRVVAEAFGLPLRSPSGPGPTTPNPWKGGGLGPIAGAGLLLAGLLLLASLVLGGDTVEAPLAVEVPVTEAATSLGVDFRHLHGLLASDLLEVDLAVGEGTLFAGPAEAVFTVTGADGAVWSARKDLCEGPRATASFALPDGAYRVEARVEPLEARREAAGRTAKLQVVHRYAVGTGGLLCGGIAAVLAALAIFGLRAGYEGKRWENADA